MLDRIAILIVRLPPLRDRRWDILLLSDHFIEAEAAIRGVEAPEIGRDGRVVLLGYPWPGNVRQLQNVLKRMVLYSRGARVLDASLLVKSLEEERWKQRSGDAVAEPTAAAAFPMREATGRVLTALEARNRHVVAVWRLEGGNVSATAELVDLTRDTVYEILDAEGLR